jgi:TIR domain
MSFLGEPFKHDLFVTYSHGDFDGTGKSKLKTWSQAFVRELEDELGLHPKIRGIEIFLDQHKRSDQGVDPMAALTKQLRIEIGAAGLLIVLMSPHYLHSKWCRQERDWWAKCQKKHGLALDGRIAIARIWPTEDPWPKIFVDEHGEPLVGFAFYDLEKAPSHPWPHEWPDPTGAKGPFRSALLDMVGRIWQHLTAVKEQLEERRQRPAEAARLAAKAGQVIYLHGREAHAKAWGRARLVLTKRQFVVTPARPDPVERNPKRAREITDRRVEILSGCDGLLLLGTEDEYALEADLIVVGRRDRHSARDRSDRLLPCAVLDTVGPKSATPEYKEMARSLGIHWIDTTRDLWPIEVEGWLAEASAVAEHV